MFTYLGAGNSRFQDIARTASPGQTVLLPCIDVHTTSKPDWQYEPYRHHHHRRETITRNGVVTSGFKDRFQLHPDGLVIKNVQTKDQGLYTCFDPQHQSHELQTRLYVPSKSNVYVLIAQYT